MRAAHGRAAGHFVAFGDHVLDGVVVLGKRREEAAYRPAEVFLPDDARAECARVAHKVRSDEVGEGFYTAPVEDLVEVVADKGLICLGGDAAVSASWISPAQSSPWPLSCIVPWR